MVPIKRKYKFTGTNIIRVMSKLLNFKKRKTSHSLHFLGNLNTVLLNLSVAYNQELLAFPVKFTPIVVN